jgi:hypothetical protein
MHHRASGSRITRALFAPTRHSRMLEEESLGWIIDVVIAEALNQA